MPETAMEVPDSAVLEYVDRLKPFLPLRNFKKTAHLKKLMELPHRIEFILCGNQGGKCQTYQTLIDTPIGKISIGKLYETGKEFEVYSWDGISKVIAKAMPPFKKIGKHKCYRITLSDGSWCEPADFHHVLTSSGWRTVHQLYIFLHNLRQSNLDISLAVQPSGVLNFPEITSGFLCGYQMEHGFYGEQPLSGQDNVPIFLPLQVDGKQYIGLLYNEGGQDDIRTDIYQTIFPHLSSLDVIFPYEDQFFGFSNDIFCRMSRSFEHGQTSFQLPYFVEVLDLQSKTLYPHNLNQFSLSYDTSFGVITETAIRDITSIPESQEVYDFTVPKYGNYFAGGLIHHNTASIAYDVVMSIFGMNDNPMHNKYCTRIRCLSSSLPENVDANAQDNAQYMELKKMLPYEAIIKDITARSQTMTIAGHQGKHYIEFMSTKQDVQDTGKVQRDRLWGDEESDIEHWNESRMRLLGFEGGLTQLSLTPINGISWTYDKLYLRASYIWRSQTIVDKCNLPGEEFYPERDKNIAVIQMATDDNPTLTPEGVSNIMDGIDDPDEYMVRRYGVFRQISGRVHKAYNPQIHYISYNRYFPHGIPYEWKHVRGIDYHESRIPWSVLWLSASKDDEWFYWREFHPAIDGPHAYTTEEICRNIIRNSGDFYYLFNLIDPLANKKQANTGFSVTEDINRIFAEIRRDEGKGTDTYWEGWDTKDTKGRDEVRKRFKNAAMIGKPFNNVKREHGSIVKVPTLWICDTCPEVNKSLLRWSFGEWATVKTRQINEKQMKPQARFSHDPMTLECIAKDIRLKYYQTPTFRPMKYSVTGRPI